MVSPVGFEEIRLIVSDLDGTLLKSRTEVEPAGALAIQRAIQAGIHVVVASARNPATVRQFCAELKTSDPIICANGAFVYASPTGKQWREALIPMNVAQQVCELADANRWELSVSTPDKNYVRQRPGQSLGLLAPTIYTVGQMQDSLVSQPHRIMAWDDEVIIAIDAFIRANLPDACRAEIFYEPDGSFESLAIFANQANKGAGLQLVLDRLNIQPEHVMAIGDNGNDIPMLELAGIGVAVGNGTDAVKATADLIAPANDKGGVAWAIEQVLAAW